MSLFKKNILQFIENQGLKKSEFYRKTGITRGVLDKDSGLTEDNLAKFIAAYPSVRLEWLLTGEEPMFNRKADNSLNTPKVITVNESNEDNVLLVPVQAQAGYLVGYNDPEFIEQLPTYSLPNIRNGIFRMFQVDGFSMYPTLQNQSYVVGQFVENWVQDITDNRLYVVVTKEHGVIVKRVLNRLEKYGNLYCKSDNRREYPNIPIAKDDIQEVWECKMQLSFEFMDPADTYEKISNLEADVEMLKDLMQKQIGQNIRSLEGYNIAAEDKNKYK